MPSLARLCLVAALALAHAACGGRAAQPSGFGAGRPAPVLLTVRNDDYRDATIYADWTGPKSRVGMVVGKTAETFEMEWRDYDVRF